MQRWILIDRAAQGRNPKSANEMVLQHGALERIGPFQLEWKQLKSGKACGMDYLAIDTGRLRCEILPARGMGIWKCWADSTEFGWQSPVQGPVHPSLVPIGDPSGIGWLEGFDELLVRCGLFSNGAPEFNANGGVVYPVHGRIANLPAHDLRCEYDERNETLDVIGTVTESRFLVYTLQLETRMRFHANSGTIEITDQVTNVSMKPSSMQLLYHINLGQPILQSGSKIHVAHKELAPRDQRASEGITTWNQCDGPETCYREQVYFVSPFADSHSWAESALINASATQGFLVQFDTRTLPVVNFWKNTAAVEDGYVVGLEPATGFPNVRSFEEKQGRVVPLQGGESRTFRLKLQPLLNASEVDVAISRIRSSQSTASITHSTPKSQWSPPP